MRDPASAGTGSAGGGSFGSPRAPPPAVCRRFSDVAGSLADAKAASQADAKSCPTRPCVSHDIQGARERRTKCAPPCRESRQPGRGLTPNLKTGFPLSRDVEGAGMAGPLMAIGTLQELLFEPGSADLAAPVTASSKSQRKAPATDPIGRTAGAFASRLTTPNPMSYFLTGPK